VGKRSNKREAPNRGVCRRFWLLRGRWCRAVPALPCLCRAGRACALAFLATTGRSKETGPPALACPHRPTCPARRAAIVAVAVVVVDLVDGDLGAPVNARELGPSVERMLDQGGRRGMPPRVICDGTRSGEAVCGARPRGSLPAASPARADLPTCAGGANANPRKTRKLRLGGPPLLVRKQEKPRVQQKMPHPVAATGDCSWCGDRALLYMRAKDGSEAERPACRPCVERGCGIRPKPNGVGGAAEHRAGSGAENDHPMAMSLLGQYDPQTLYSPAARLPMAICAVHATNEIVCKKRANGGAGIEGAGVAGMYQCGSILPGSGVVAEFENGRSPFKRQRTALSSEA
jgi:hypothetical protein